jgi:hypothetical protein
VTRAVTRRSAINKELTADQSQALLRVLVNYASALDQYNHQRLRVAPETVVTSKTESFELTP